MALDDILLEAEEKMIKTEQVVQHEFAGVRTGKASPAIVENIMVEVYGSNMRIRELAGITTPESRMLLIQPWDVATAGPIVAEAAKVGDSSDKHAGQIVRTSAGTGTSSSSTPWTPCCRICSAQASLSCWRR